MNHNGKIGRLPKMVREQLNRRLDDNEPGKRLVEWLNSLPEVQAFLAAEFEGKPISEQNLSEWMKRGYRDWQQRQERRELVQQLEDEAGDLGTIVDNRAFNRRLSAVLMLDLAQAMRDVMEHATDPRKRAQCLGRLVGKFAQLRREESNADRVQVVRERWERKLAKQEEYKRADGLFAPTHALLLQRLYIDGFGRDNEFGVVSSGGVASGPCADAAAPASLLKTDPTESNQIKPNQTG